MYALRLIIRLRLIRLLQSVKWSEHHRTLGMSSCHHQKKNQRSASGFIVMCLPCRCISGWRTPEILRSPLKQPPPPLCMMHTRRRSCGYLPALICTYVFAFCSLVLNLVSCRGGFTRSWCHAAKETTGSGGLPPPPPPSGASAAVGRNKYGNISKFRRSTDWRRSRLKRWERCA